MPSLDSVRDWMAEHGYRDRVPRRDAIDRTSLHYVFVKDGFPKIGVQSVGGQVAPEHFEQLKLAVIQHGQGKGSSGN